MKNILLATTALVMTTGYAAAEFKISASAKIAYGNFGEEHKAGSASKTTTSTEAGGVAAQAAVAGTLTADEIAASTSLAGDARTVVQADVDTVQAAVTAAATGLANAQADLAAGIGSLTAVATAQTAVDNAAASAAAIAGTPEVAASGTAGAGYAYSDTFDVVVSGNGEAIGVAYSASMTID